jgi:hypothetical protein
MDQRKPEEFTAKSAKIAKDAEGEIIIVQPAIAFRTLSTINYQPSTPSGLALQQTRQRRHK